MKVCIPTASKGGMSAEIYGHFGSAPYFTVIDTGTGKVESIDNTNSHHTHGACRPMDALADDIDAVISGGMGHRAISRLTESGIKVYLSTGKTVKDALEDLKNGKLKPISDEDACGEHSCQ